MSRRSLLLEEGKQVHSRLSVFYAGKGHSVARYYSGGVLDPCIESLVTPSDPCRLQGGGIPAETRKCTGLPVPYPGQTWPRHVGVGLERMTGGTSTREQLLSLVRITCFRNCPGGQQDREDDRQDSSHLKPLVDGAGAPTAREKNQGGSITCPSSD